MKNNKLSEERRINQGVREGCPSSFTLVNIYMNEIIAKWNIWYWREIRTLR